MCALNYRGEYAEEAREVAAFANMVRGSPFGNRNNTLFLMVETISNASIG